MSQFWSEGVTELHPYVPGEQPQGERLLKLNTNESPYGPSPAIAAALHNVNVADLRLYPDPASRKLSAALAEYHSVPVDSVFVGNGSDEVLGFVFRAFFKGKGPLCFPDISYSFYPVWAQLFEIETHTLPVTKDYRIELSAIPKELKIVIFPNPNAPTAIALGLGELEAFVKARPDTLVVVDEAYVDYGAESAVTLLGTYTNLLVVRTMSKSRGLAGLRVGYALGAPDLIEGLVRVKDSFNSYPLDALAQLAALVSIEDESYFQATLSKVVASRARLTRGLESLGFEVLPSTANFVLARNPAKSGGEWQASLRSQGIIVRHFNKPRLEDWIRITVGTDAEVDRLLDALASCS
jgi:histidinol-phosphate aminotransferase